MKMPKVSAVTSNEVLSYELYFADISRKLQDISDSEIVPKNFQENSLGR